MRFPIIAAAFLVATATLVSVTPGAARATPQRGAVACQGREARVDEQRNTGFYQCVGGRWQRVQCPGRAVAVEFAAGTIRCVPPVLGRAGRG